MSLSDFKSLEEAIESFKKLRAKYVLQRKHLKKSRLPDSHLDNIRNEIIELGKLLEGNGIDVHKLQ